MSKGARAMVGAKISVFNTEKGFKIAAEINSLLSKKIEYAAEEAGVAVVLNTTHGKPAKRVGDDRGKDFFNY
jgi:hypothetical protein